jgi:hypothetical protein
MRLFVLSVISPISLGCLLFRLVLAGRVVRELLSSASVRKTSYLVSPGLYDQQFAARTLLSKDSAARTPLDSL